jgi:hypothetical protein
MSVYRVDASEGLVEFLHKVAGAGGAQAEPCFVAKLVAQGATLDAALREVQAPLSAI